MFPGRDKKLLEQLALAKEAGTQGMAKEFFAKTPGSGGDPAAEAAEEAAEGEAMPSGAPAAEAAPADPAASGELTPEQLEQLLAALGGADDTQGA